MLFNSYKNHKALHTLVISKLDKTIS